MAIGTATNASRRRLLYGVNVIISSVLALALLIVVVYFAGKYQGQLDLTRTGVNSLADGTVKLLGGLEEDVKITGIYTVLTEYDEIAQKRRDYVSDLLDLYQAAGRGRVSTFMVEPMKEQGKVTQLLRRLREKPAYKDESAPHAAALGKFPALNARIQDLGRSEVEELQGFAQSDARLQRVREYGIITNYLSRIGGTAEGLTKRIDELLGEDVPLYGAAVEEARQFLTDVRPTLQEVSDWMRTDGVSLPGLTPELRKFFEESPTRYATLLTEIEALVKEMQDLERVKLEEVYDKLTRWPTSPPILVETSDGARVLDLQEVWPWRMDRSAPSPDKDPREFAGEQAISSAILQLTQKEKTAVVFTRFGGESPITPDFSRMDPMMRQIPRAPYQELNALLLKANFLTEDWDVSTQKTPPPVEGAGRTIYVVFPPEPPPQPDPRQPSPQTGITPADVDIIVNAVNESGMAIFLAGWAQPTSPMMPVGGTYEFGEYLKSTWGVDVQHRFLALQFVTAPQNPDLWIPASRYDPLTGRNDPLVMPTSPLRFTAHDITEPLQAVPGAFHMVCPLRLVEGEDRPEGVTIETVAEIADTETVWAFENLMRLQQDLQENRGTTPAETDVRAPFPVAVAATGAEERRIVVFGSQRFAMDALAQAMSMQLSAKGLLQTYPSYPANTDLFVNALHWLTGNADRIAVGPRRSDVPRLDKLAEGGTAMFCRVFLVGIWPGLALLAGAGVWLLRRR